MFLRSWDLIGLLEIVEKYLATSGSPGVFVNTWKTILKLWELSRTCRNSKKYLATSGSPVEFINNWKIFWSFGDFLGLVEIVEKCLATSGSSGVFVNTWKHILKLWRHFRTCGKPIKMFRNFRKSWSVSKSLLKCF